MSINMSKQNRWSVDDNEIDEEFAAVISIVNEQNDAQTDKQQKSAKIPSALDRKIKAMAHGSSLENLEKSWIFSHGARLTLVVLVFFAVAMIWTTL